MTASRVGADADVVADDSKAQPSSVEAYRTADGSAPYVLVHVEEHHHGVLGDVLHGLSFALRGYRVHASCNTLRASLAVPAALAAGAS